MLGTGPLLGHAVQLLKRLQSYAVMAMVSHGYSLSFVSAIKRLSVQARIGFVVVGKIPQVAHSGARKKEAEK